MSNATKYWVVGGGAFAFLAVLYCMTRGKTVETPLGYEMEDDQTSPFYLTYNMPDPIVATMPNGQSSGRDIVFGDIVIGGSTTNMGNNNSGGDGGGCCDPCSNKTKQLFSTFSSATIPDLPQYQNTYVPRAMDSLSTSAMPTNWGSYKCSSSELSNALGVYADMLGMSKRDFLANQRRQANGTFAFNLAPTKKGETQVDAIYRHGKQYTPEMACECIKYGSNCGHYLTADILRGLVDDSGDDTQPYMFATPAVN